MFLLELLYGTASMDKYYDLLIWEGTIAVVAFVVVLFVV